MLRRVGAGDGEAMAELYLIHRPWLLALLRQMVSAAEAEDLLQEVFARAWLRSGDYDDERGTVGAWLRVLARSCALDRLRAGRARRRRETRWHHLDRPPLAMASAGTHALETRQAHARLRAGLDRLPRDQRLAIKLGFFAGLSHQQVARRLGVPLGTAKSRIRLGLRRLRAMLRPVA